MLDDISRVMLKLSRELKPTKLMVLANHWAPNEPKDYLLYNGTRVYRSDQIKIIGYQFSTDLQERPDIEHLVQRAWACYGKWAHVQWDLCLSV